MSIKKCFERTPFFAGCPLAVRLKYSVSHRKGVHTQRQKKKEEEKGFDLLDAIYLEKGLVAAGSPHSMGVKAIPWPKEACAASSSLLLWRLLTKDLPSFGRSTPLISTRLILIPHGSV